MKCVTPLVRVTARIGEKYAASLLARKRGEKSRKDGYAGRYIVEWAAEMPEDADPVEWGYAFPHGPVGAHREVVIS